MYSMKNLPWFLLLFSPVPVLSQQVVHLYQVPWWAGLRFAALSLIPGMMILALFWLIFPNFIKNHSEISKALNLITASMLLVLLGVIGFSGITRDGIAHKTPRNTESGQDIYFIVLDSYTGSHALLERFNYDNSAFIRQLELLGFQVGDCKSKYTYTGASLGSILNGGINAPIMSISNWKLLQRSQLRTTLEQRGYDTIAFATGYDWDEIRDAAYFLEPPHSPGLTEFELFLLGSPSWKDRKGELFRERTLYLLKYLDAAARLPGSQFTYAHIEQPHPPFVFQADGSPLADETMVEPGWNGDSKSSLMYSWENYAAGYTGQVEFISSAILASLENVLQKDPDPLIMLLGDHGAWYTNDDAFSILCASYGDLPMDPGEAVMMIIGE